MRGYCVVELNQTHTNIYFYTPHRPGLYTSEGDIFL